MTIGCVAGCEAARFLALPLVTGCFFASLDSDGAGVLCCDLRIIASSELDHPNSCRNTTQQTCGPFREPKHAAARHGHSIGPWAEV